MRRLLLAGAMAATLAGCGGSSGPTPSPTASDTSSSRTGGARPVNEDVGLPMTSTTSTPGMGTSTPSMATSTPGLATSSGSSPMLAGGPTGSRSPGPRRPNLKPPPPPSPAAQDYHVPLNRGMDMALRREFKQAIPELEKAETLAPDDPDVNMWLFISYQGSEDTPSVNGKAYHYAQRVLEILPGSVQANRANEYIRMVHCLSKTPRGTGKRPADIAGFDKAQLGMSEEELKKAYGKDIEPFPGPYQNPSNYVRYWIPALYIAGKRYTVLFPFDAQTHRLSGIYLRPPVYPSGSRLDFEALQKYLTELYGTPDGSDDLSDPMALRLRTVWNFPGGSVHLNLYAETELSVTVLRP